jgi:hypothetical protein
MKKTGKLENAVVDLTSSKNSSVCSYHIQKKDNIITPPKPKELSPKIERDCRPPLPNNLPPEPNPLPVHPQPLHNPIPELLERIEQLEMELKEARDINAKLTEM